MIGIETTEAAIVARLKDVGLAYDVQPYPEKPTEFRFTHPLGVVLVRYNKTSFTPPSTMGVVVQDATASFDLTVIGRALRGATGAYLVVDQVRNALTGWQYEGARVYPVSEDFVENDDGAWSFGMSYAVPLTHIQIDDDVDGPLLTHITTADNLGETQEITS